MEQYYILKAIDAALKAGEQILSIYEDPASDFQVERKADNSPLTIADRKAHQVISKMLADTPYPILSEEGRSIPYKERSQWESLWIVDPLDGTKEFIKRNGEFTVNIAFVEDGSPVAGVIYVPVKKTLYFGAIGTGAFKCSDIVSVGSDVTLQQLMGVSERMPSADCAHSGLVVVASRSHMNSETEAYIEELKKAHGEVRTVSKGSSLKICLVAEGAADIYPRFAPTMEWDTAAGHAIAVAAGLEVYRADGDVPLRYNKEDLLNPWFVVKANVN